MSKNACFEQLKAQIAAGNILREPTICEVVEGFAELLRELFPDREDAKQCVRLAAYYTSVIMDENDEEESEYAETSGEAPANG
jgi:hypothetical protein